MLELFFKIEERGGQATLAVTTDSGKTKIKFEVASPSTTFGTGSMPTSSAAPQPAPGKRKRSGAARRKAKLRAAAHQATLAAAASAASPPSASSPPRPPRPLHHLLSPSPSSGRRRVMPLGRPEMLTFSSLNLDGATSLPPTTPSPTPPPSSPTPRLPLPQSTIDNIAYLKHLLARAQYSDDDL